MPTLFLSRNDIKVIIDMGEVIGVVEEAFREWANGAAKMPPKAYLVLEKGDFRAMPAALPGAAGLKWVNVHPGNPPLGLPTVMAIMIYNDPATGYPLSVMDATEITAYRTGAIAAIASKYLARKDSHTLGIIGAGRQAYTQLLAHATLFDIKLIKVYDPIKSAVERFIKSFPGYRIEASSSPEDACACDILCTVTPAHEPVVKRKWLLPGTHINAIGADAAGKEELEPSVLKDALVIVDDIRQASTSGEINVPVRKGLFTVEEVHASLSEIITGKRPGRSDRDQITVFDSTGVAIEDVATAGLIYEKAKKSRIGISLDFVEG